MVSFVSLIPVFVALLDASFAGEVPASKQTEITSKFWNNGISGYSAGGYNMFSTSGSAAWGNNMFSDFFSSTSMSASWSTCYGVTGLSLAGGYPALGGYFAKAVDPASVSRRAISLDAERLYRRDSDETVTCTGKNDQKTFNKNDCRTAAQLMVTNKASEASCNSCKLTIVTRNGKITPKDHSAKVLDKAVNHLLENCGKSTVSPAKRSNHKKPHVLMMLHATNTQTCS